MTRTILDLAKPKTTVFDLSNVLNPRVNDDLAKISFHIQYDNKPFNMTGYKMYFISADENMGYINVDGMVDKVEYGDNVGNGDVTFKFPANVFKKAGTFDSSKTMFVVENVNSNYIQSTINVSLTVLENGVAKFNADVDQIGYDSKLEEIHNKYKNKAQNLIDELINQVQAVDNFSNVKETAEQAKQVANDSIAKANEVNNEVTTSRSRFSNLNDRLNNQDIKINSAETTINANANYNRLTEKDLSQDIILSNKADKVEIENRLNEQETKISTKADKNEVERKLSQISLVPEAFDNVDALKSKYPNGKTGIFITVDTGHKWIYSNQTWVDAGIYQSAGINDTSVTKALRSQEINKLNLQNKIWQRRLGINVVNDKWIDEKGIISSYQGWCYTPNYIAVESSTNYIFCAKSSAAIHYEIIGISSVYICLYDENKNFIKQIYTLKDGKFNTDNAKYIRFSMSSKTVGDRLYPSLIKGEELPSQLEDSVYAVPETNADLVINSFEKYSMINANSLYKMNDLPLYIYEDALIQGDMNSNVKVYLYNNYSNLICRNNTNNGWLVPKNSGNLTLDWYGLMGHAPNSYWNYSDDILTKQTTTFINEIPNDSGKGQNIKVLIIGDSLTNYNVYPNRAGELANSDENTTIEFIGTRGDNTKHEGRGGWSAKYYCTKSSFNTYNNLFLNNGKFDFSNYMNTNKFSKVDIVIINLGTNDVTYNNILNDPNFELDFKAYDEMISSIKAYDSNIKIALGSTITPARFKNTNVDVKTRRQEWNNKIQVYCSDNNYTYIPYWLVVDPINDFKYEDVQIDDYNTTTIKKVADNTHPADSGYKKMGDLTYATIKKIAEDIRTGK